MVTTSVSRFSGFISSRIETFVRLAVHGILSILLQQYISNAAILCCSIARIVQVFAAYKKTGKTRVCIRRILVRRETSRSFQTLVKFVRATFASYILLLISFSQPPLLEMSDPKYTNSWTTSQFAIVLMLGQLSFALSIIIILVFR